MVSDGQHVVKVNEGDVDDEVAAFVADVLELAGSFRRVAEGVAHAAGLTQTLWYALSVFSDAPTTVAQGARRLGTSRQALQRTANELLARGLAVIEPNPDHRASPFIRLTPTGRTSLDQLTAAARETRHQWLPDSDIDALRIAHLEVRRLRDTLRDTLRAAGEGLTDLTV